MSIYLVTGAGGFIGSALVRALLERGEHVRAVDNFSSSAREAFGYDPVVAFAEGRRRTVAWYRERMGDAVPAVGVQ